MFGVLLIVVMRKENPHNISDTERFISIYTARLKTLLLVENVKNVITFMMITNAASITYVAPQMKLVSCFLNCVRALIILSCAIAAVDSR